MAKRKSISKTTRFEVFKRDKFTCQYCGGKAPDVVLVVDHINPVAAGGENELLNLATACDGCNAGKGARKLGDASEVERQRQQLESLQERRDQLDMMLAWKKGLLDLDGHAQKELADAWSKLAPGYELNDGGLQILGGYVRKYGASEVLDAMSIAADRYLRFSGKPPKLTSESVNSAWKYVGGILYNEREKQTRPYIHDLCKLRAAVRNNKHGYYDERQATMLLDRAFMCGITTAELWRVVYDAGTWAQWRNAMEELIDEREDHGNA